MICILHGYLLEGSGSNLWTRSVVESLCRQGRDVHLVAQENHPDRYPFITEWRQYHPDGRVDRSRLRASPYAGECVLHRPILGELLPVYVWDHYEEFPRVVPMIDLSDAEIEEYLQRNVNAVETIVRENGVKALHANHSVLMSVVAERVGDRTGVPFTVMPHGSALEFAVKRDERFHRLAARSFAAARKIFVQGEEMWERVRETLPSVPGLEGKMDVIHLGVDTSQFEPITPGERRSTIAELREALRGVPRGRTAEQTRRLRDGLTVGMDEAALLELFSPVRSYDGKSPDADLEARLEEIDWEREKFLLFVGRLISTKGIHGVIAALPLLLAQVPEMRLLVVGHGPLREPLEAMLYGLEKGDRELVELIVARGVMLEGSVEGASGEAELTQVAAFFDRLRAAGALDDYFEIAQRHVRRDRVIFTGYLTHRELHLLFPCCDAAVFPSVVKEAGPLVFLEAIASGVFPLGTYFGGMKASIDAVSNGIPAGTAELMKLDADPESTVADIVEKGPPALAEGSRHREALNRIARERFDWTSVAAKLADELDRL